MSQDLRNAPRANSERTRVTRGALVQSARALFIRQGYAQTSTPDIARAARVTRGALYHHFRDKSDLFREVVAQEALAVADEIEAAVAPAQLPVEALRAGAEAYLDAMTVPGRTRLLLIEGPAVLGLEAMRTLDEANAERTLVAGLAAAMEVSDRTSVAPMAALLSAAFDRAALAIDDGDEAAAYRRAMLDLISRVVQPVRGGPGQP